MASQHISEAAHFAPSHCVRLTGDAERSCTCPVDMSRSQMKVDNGIAFIGSATRLISALTEERNHTLRTSDQLCQLRKQLRLDHGFFAQILPKATRQFAGAR